MNENLKRLFEKIKNNKALIEKFKVCKTDEEAYTVATSIADGYTIEEFKEITTKIYNAVKNSNSELSDEDLNQVAGGFPDWILPLLDQARVPIIDIPIADADVAAAI